MRRLSDNWGQVDQSTFRHSERENSVMHTCEPMPFSSMSNELCTAIALYPARAVV